MFVKIELGYAMAETDAFDGTYKFSAEAYSGNKQSLPTLCRPGCSLEQLIIATFPTRISP
jgi:hypothetical protein